MKQNTHGALAAHSTTGQPRAVARQDVGPRPFTRFFPATETMVAHTPSQLPLSFETPTSPPHWGLWQGSTSPHWSPLWQRSRNSWSWRTGLCETGGHTSSPSSHPTRSFPDNCRWTSPASSTGSTVYAVVMRRRYIEAFLNLYISFMKEFNAVRYGNAKILTLPLVFSHQGSLINDA